MLKYDDITKHRLTELKNCFVLFKDGSIGILKGWKVGITRHTPLFGRSYEVESVTKLLILGVEHVGTDLVGVATDGLDKILEQLEEARIRFIKCRQDMDKFGYAFRGKVKPDDRLQTSK